MSSHKQQHLTNDDCEVRKKNLLLQFVGQVIMQKCFVGLFFFQSFMSLLCTITNSSCTSVSSSASCQIKNHKCTRLNQLKYENYRSNKQMTHAHTLAGKKMLNGQKLFLFLSLPSCCLGICIKVTRVKKMITIVLTALNLNFFNCRQIHTLMTVRTVR